MILRDGGTSAVNNFGWNFNPTLYSFLGIQFSDRYTSAELFISLCSLNWNSLTGSPQNLVLSNSILFLSVSNFIFRWPRISVRFVLITNLTHFLNVFISLLYMFRATQCSSSGESSVSIHHLVYITVCRWPSGMQVRELLSHLHTRRPPTQNDM